MSTPEVHKVIHDVINEDIRGLKEETMDTKKRVIILESSDKVFSEQLKNTMKSLDSLIGWIKWLLGIMVVSYLSFFAWLMQQRLI